MNTKEKLEAAYPNGKEDGFPVGSICTPAFHLEGAITQPGDILYVTDPPENIEFPIGHTDKVIYEYAQRCWNQTKGMYIRAPIGIIKLLAKSEQHLEGL